MSQLINSNYFLNNDIKEIKKSNEEVIKELSLTKLSEKTINQTLEDLKHSGSSVDFAPVYKKINDIEQSVKHNRDEAQSEIHTLNSNIHTNINDIKILKNSTEGFNYQIYYTDSKRMLSALLNKQPNFKKPTLYRIPFLAPKNDISKIMALGNIKIFIRGYQDIEQFHYINGSNGWFPDNQFSYVQYEPIMKILDVSNNFKISAYSKKFDIVFDCEKKELYIDFLIIPPLIESDNYSCVLPKNIVFARL